MLNAENIPAELRTLHQWLTWKIVTRDGKPTKIPFNAVSGACAKSNDSSTWTDFETARLAVETSDHDGIGFVFAAGGGLFGIDLDCCVSPDGEIAPWAAKIVADFATYAEVSPSGHGIKLFARGKIDRGRAKKLPGQPIDGRDPGIEIYGQGRYFAVTGQKIGSGLLTDCQAQIDALAAELWPANTLSVNTRTATPITERARRYLATMPPAVSGQGGHNTTFRVACVLVLGFNLSPEDAYALLAEWNATCLPPWSERELQHKINSANAKEGERGWLLRDNGRYEGPDVDLRRLLSSLNGSTGSSLDDAQPEAKRSPVEPGIPAELLNGAGGLLGEIVDFNLRTAHRRQYELAMAAAITLVASLIARKVTDDSGTHSNIYIIGLGASGCGKEHARQVNKLLLSLVSGDAFLQDEIASGIGLFNALVESPVTLWQPDEFGRVLATLQGEKTAPHLQQIITMMLRLYSGARDPVFAGPAYADRTKNEKVYCPHLIVYGTTVTRSFTAALNRESLSDGFLNRLLVIESTNPDPELQEPETFEPSQKLVDDISWWMKYSGTGTGNLNPTPRKMIATPEAKAVFQFGSELIRQHRRNEEPQGTQIWGRAYEACRKLALIHACSLNRETTSISEASAQWGCRLAIHLTERVQYLAAEYIADGEFDDTCKKVLQFLRAGGTNGRTRRDVSRVFRGMDRRELDAVLGKLAETEEVRSETILTGGRPSIVLCAV